MDEVQYSDVLQRLKEGSQKRDPRSVRLAAVTSALVEVVEGDDVTAAKVYARTVTALEGILFSETTSLTESLATQVALLELLATTLPFVTPTAIVSASLTLTSRVLRGVITASQSVSIEGSTMETKDELGGANAALRWTCKAATEVLKRLDGRQKNVDEKVIQQLLLGTLITCMEDRRPKVRKAAQNGVIEVLVMEEPHRCHSAVRKAVSSYAHAEIQKRTESKQNDSLGDLLHLLGFLDRAIPYLAYQKLGSDIMELATALFQVEESTSSMDFVSVKVGQATPKVLVISSSLSVISSLLENTDPERKGVLDGFAPRVLASLIQAKPSLIFRRGYAEFEILQKGRTVFGQALLSACRRVLSSKTDLGAKLLPLSVQMILSIATPNDDESEKNSTVAETLLVELTQLFRESLTSFIQSGAPGLDKCLNDCLHSMQQVISPSFLPSTSISLNCLAVLVQQLWQSPQVPEIIEGLIQCRKESAGDSSSQQAIDDAFSSIVQGVGIEVFWDWIQWNPDSAKTAAGGIRLDRAFILPTMKVAANTADAGGQKLAFFQSRILGLARECDKLAASSKEVKFHQARVVDLWSLLPCFCRRAVDIVASLPALTSVLKKALEDRHYPQLVLFISAGLVSLVSSDGGGISTTQSEILSEAAVELLPVMFKIVALNDKPPTEDLKTQMKMTASEVSERSHQTQSLCEAIAALSRCAPTPFLHGLFKKLMQRLLEEAQSGISDSSKVCAFLCLCQSLVSSRVLDENSISFLYRALKPMIRNDEQDARIQKRAYKVLAEMCECHHSFFFDITRLQETIELLTGTMGTSQIAARHMRLKCMNIIIDGFDDTHSEHVDELMHVLAEILLCLKDPNAKTREAGYQLLLSIAMRKDMAGFLQTVTAALGAETPHMRSAAVMALSRLVFEFGWEDESLHILLPSLLRTVLVLVNENSREVIKSTIGFIRISVAAIPAEQLEPVLPELLGGLLHYHKAKSRFRSKIKIILKKLIKLFGYDALTPYVPETETRLLTHMRKLEERQARRKAEAKAEGRNMDQFDEMFDSDEEDSDDGRTWMSGATGFTKLTARNGGKLRSVARSSDSKMSKATMASRATSTSASKLESSTRLPDETDGDVVDMLDSKFAKRVKFNDQSANSDSDGAMEFDDDGRLIVRDEGAVVALESMDEGRAEQQQKFIGNKRQRLGKLDCVKTKESDVKSKKSGKRGRELGSQYKSKKAGGDVRKKDQKFEPYAFVPLDGKSYSKKNRRGAVEQMSSVVRQGGKRKR